MPTSSPPGHHARIRRAGDGTFRLLRATDRRKDQSYVLSVLGQQQLAQARFPVGEFSKTRVRELAAHFGLSFAGKQESQDLCFLGDGDYRRFLRDHAPELMQPGPIIHSDGAQLGEHRGLANYTIGQRRGLGLNTPRPMFVVGKQAQSNALLVAERAGQGVAGLRAGRVNWVCACPPQHPFRAEVCIRYGGQPHPATISPDGPSDLSLRFESPQAGVAPGQAVVIYDGETCLGGGVITSAA